MTRRSPRRPAPRRRPAAAAIPASRRASAASRSRRTRSSTAGDKRLASSHERPATAGRTAPVGDGGGVVEGTGDVLVGTGRGERAVPGPRRRGVGQLSANARWAARRAVRGGVVVDGRPHQRVPERQTVTVERHDAVILRQLQLGHPEVSCRRAHAMMCDQVAVGLGGGDEQRGQRRRRQPLEHQVDDTVTRCPDRQRIGQRREPRPLVGVEQLWPSRRGPAGSRRRRRRAPGGRSRCPHRRRRGCRRPPHRGRVEGQDRPGVGHRVRSGPACRHHRHPLELQAAGDERQRATGRQIDPRQIVDEHDTGPRLGRIDQQVTGAEGDSERLDRRRWCPPATARRAPPPPEPGPDCRAPPQEVVDQPGQSRPWQLDLGLDTPHPNDACTGLTASDEVSGLVEHGGLADARLADDGKCSAMAVSGPPDEIQERSDDVAWRPRSEGREM